MSKLKWFILGGVAAAYLSPKSGKELRDNTKQLLERTLVDIKNLTPEELKLVFGDKFEMVKEYIETFDANHLKEKVSKVILDNREVVKNLLTNKEK